MDACTIVSRRELARARVLAATLHEHYPDVTLTILLLDGDPASAGEVEHARLLGLEEVVGGEQAGLLAAANPPGALAAAVLPRLARRLLDEAAGAVIYLGAGQRVLGPLRELTELAGSDEIVLVSRSVADPAGTTGEALASFAADHAHGAFSRELLALRDGPATRALLAAWPSYFADAGDNDDGAAAVSGWLDRVPAIAADVGVLRHSGYGLDPSSLDGRTIGGGAGGDLQDGGGLQVDGQAARALDLGELDPEDPPALFDGDGRIRLSAAPMLERLVMHYLEDLRAAGWEQDVAAYNSPYAQLEDGLRPTPTIRALLIEAIAEGKVTHSPLSAQGRAELYEYLNEPDGRGREVGLTRLHMAIWEARADLRSGYPHIDGPDGAGLAGWLCLHGAEQEGLVPALLPPTPELAYRDANPHVHEDPPRWGVNVAGFFTAELGVGEAARLLISGLDAAAIPALPIQGHLAPPSRLDERFAYARIDEAAYPVNILCINGDGVPLFAREAGRAFFEGRYTIALWWWEVGEPPADWAQAYEFLDEIWVASQHIYDAIAPSSPVPVVRMTLPVLPPKVAERTRAELGLPEGFLFMYVHDYHSVAARKNPLGLIEAFRRAFPPGSGAKLVIKSINAETRPQEHERIVLAARGHEDIVLLDAYVSAAEKNAMIAACDCYVSLHRSEGFGLTAAEAMLLGKPVIATRYGGTMEFMNDENSYLVRWEPTAVGEGAYPYPPAGIWAQPDLDHAAELMRHVFEAREQARERGLIAQRELLDRHSPEVAGEGMRRRLALINERLYQEGARALNLAHLPALSDGATAPAVVNRPPAIGWGSGRLARLRERLLRPVANWSQAYTAHQSQVEAEGRDAIVRVEALGARLDSRLREVAQTLQDQQQAQHAEALAVLRGLQGGRAVRREDG